MPKILKIVDSCGGCPQYCYYSGGQYECKLVGEIVPDKTVIASFCPLTEFPSRMLADMDATIRRLREPNKYGLVLALLSHIATKLKTNVSAHGVITITLKDGTSVYLRHDAITETLPQEGTVIFWGNDRKYKLHPDAVPPQLYGQFVRDDIPGEHWEHLYIAT